MVDKYFYDNIFSEGHHLCRGGVQHKYLSDAPMFITNIFRHLFIRSDTQQLQPKKFEQQTIASAIRCMTPTKPLQATFLQDQPARGINFNAPNIQANLNHTAKNLNLHTKQLKLLLKKIGNSMHSYKCNNPDPVDSR